MTVYCLTLLAVTCLLGSRFSAGYPFSGENKHFDKVTIDIRNVTNTTALMEWVVPQDQGHVDSYTVSCTSESHPLQLPTSSEANKMALTDLIPNTDYSCSLLANDKTSSNGGRNILNPIHFTTLNTTTKGSVAMTNTPGFTTGATKNTPLLLLSILLPICLLTICILGCVLNNNKTKSYKEDENKKPVSYKSVSYRGKGSNPDSPKKDYKKLWKDMLTKYKLPALQIPNTGNLSLFDNNGNQVLDNNSPKPVLHGKEAETEIRVSSQMPLTVLDLSTPLLPSMQTQLTEDHSKLNHNLALDFVQPPFPPPSEDDIII